MYMLVIAATVIALDPAPAPPISALHAPVSMASSRPPSPPTDLRGLSVALAARTPSTLMAPTTLTVTITAMLITSVEGDQPESNLRDRPNPSGVADGGVWFSREVRYAYIGMGLEGRFLVAIRSSLNWINSCVRLNSIHRSSLMEIIHDWVDQQDGLGAVDYLPHLSHDLAVHLSLNASFPMGHSGNARASYMVVGSGPNMHADW